MRFEKAVKITDLKPWRNNPRKHDADIAAQSIGRRAVLLEDDPRYCDVIIERWETVSGGKAKRVSHA